ncbi:MAG: hypothetical protein ACOH2H_01955 [Cypionkella sp.]
MPQAKDDASTDIDTKVKAFAKAMNDEMASWSKTRAAEIAKAEKDGKPNPSLKPLPSVTFSVSQNKVSKSRTPAEQAVEVAAGKSWVCWGAHMADKARHVVLKVDGKVNWDAGKALGKDFAEFKTIWARVMKSNGLKNFKAGDGWAAGDELHLELPDSKIGREDERAQSCIAEYVRITRTAGKQNAKFEKSYSKDIEKYAAKYKTSTP